MFNFVRFATHYIHTPPNIGDINEYVVLETATANLE